MREKKEVARTRRLLMRDKLCLPDNYRVLLLCDVNKLLSHYMELTESGAEVKISVLDSGGYEITVSAQAVRVKDIPLCVPTLE